MPVATPGRIERGATKNKLVLEHKHREPGSSNDESQHRSAQSSILLVRVFYLGQKEIQDVAEFAFTEQAGVSPFWVKNMSLQIKRESRSPSHAE